ncbi:hypothetical protein J7F02_34055 [Streptomyces sp. ISL-112]|uniref:hypothetical protein n=1 Tax=unclassified Streptomyces TaxID=2593676 RepID=UPI001BEC7607|nr:MULTISPECIES: hypothetical protein [unclassified Streptomyces]MBT2430468.1 hypothetical protein [Streptomyces sp. ISL-112]MBT2466175.1 hypothetical protein [Streptomyces sp. ISL-63]
MATAVTLTLSGVCHAQEPTAAQAVPQVQEVIGQGTGDCPSMSLCLYEDLNLNQSKAARIWVFAVTDARTDYSLRGHAAANKPSSGYMRTPRLGWTAHLFPDYRCGFEGDREAEAISFRSDQPYNSLNGHVGRAKRYGYFSSNGTWSREKYWGITEQGLNLNDRAGCISVGAFRNTDELRPQVSGDM